MPLDAPISIANKARYFVGYDEDGTIFYPTFSNISQLADNDLEGLTYLEEDYFILVEEDRNDIYFLEYNKQNEEFEILSRYYTGINLGSTSDGLEGISYDPHTKLLFLVREHQQTELFSIPIVLPNANSDGAINILGKQSVVLPSTVFTDNNANTDNDASGLFHFGKIVDSSSQLSNNLLILSEGLKKVVEFDVTFDAGNNLAISYIDEYPLPLENQPEGITVYDGKIYVAGEVDQDDPQNNPATLSGYALSNTILSCKIFDTNCNCLDQPGCTDPAACNYDSAATEDDDSCYFVEDPCDDNNANSQQDEYDSNCNCVGKIFGCDDDDACNYNPQANANDGSCLYANAACDDGNSDTKNDIIRDPSCNCAGEYVFGCTDNTACNYNPDATVNTSCTYPGTSCNNQNPNFTYNDNCLCVETCPEDIEHNTTLSSGNYIVSNSIKSTATINQNQNVVYDAGASICLDKGFLADSNMDVFLLAKIDGCTQLRTGNFVEQNNSIKNFPNPFNGETTIEFELNEASKASLVVTDFMGKVVATLADDESKEIGVHQLKFNGNHLPQGIYYSTLIANNRVSTQKMILIK